MAALTYPIEKRGGGIDDFNDNGSFLIRRRFRLAPPFTDFVWAQRSSFVFLHFGPARNERSYSRSDTKTHFTFNITIVI